MARSLVNKPNVDPVDGDYPYARIKDDDGSNNGTPVDEEVYGDIHQFFEKMMDVAGVVHNEQPDNNYSGFQLFEALLALMGGCLTKTIEIGDWNMDSTLNKTVAHGLTLDQIRGIDIMIRNDAGTTFNPVDNYSADIGCSITATDVSISRTIAGIFDNTDYDSTGYNRGWIIIRYEP